ncbi:hypothetical protein VPNG_01977 [Cytospora leucostoma]|uniref:Transcription factor domain-containing protein n=1 Tax=Cytospora leucostoma TaxID=1230097 RepID=A0A423XIK6_9PEZI|nr:hypothetical protein VPNG_01977 [Cytospora leucostoma]
MAASISDVRSMRGQMFSIIQRLTNEIFVESNRSMDLLQGILVILAWYHNHCVMHTQLNNLLHIAQAILADLGLNKSPEIQERSSVMVLNPPKPHQRTNEERRAILGVWFLTSSVATGLQKVFPMKFSRYIKQCLENLEAAPEFELDTLLLYLVKIQHLTQQIRNWSTREDEDDEDVPGLLRVPASAYQAAFHGDITRLQASLPLSLRDDKLLRVHFTFATLHLNEPPPIDAALLKELANSFTKVDSITPSALDIFYRSQFALQAFFESIFDIPTTIYSAMPLPIMIPVLYSVTMLARWAKILGPGRPTRGRHAPPDILTPQKVIWDPSATRPAPNTMFGSGLAPLPSFTANSTSAIRIGPETRTNTDTPSVQDRTSQAATSARLINIPPPITDPSQIPTSQFQEAADPSIPSIVASLRSRLQAQPGLNLDIIAILATLAQRCEQVHDELTQDGGGGVWHNDVWYLFSKKVLIARAKLEKWAEIISSGGGAPTGAVVQKPSGNQSAERTTGVQNSGVDVTNAELLAGHSSLLYQDGDAVAAFQPQIELAGQSALPEQSVDGGWQYGDIWADDVFDQLDPSLWLSDWGDWEKIC